MLAPFRGYSPIFAQLSSFDGSGHSGIRPHALAWSAGTHRITKLRPVWLNLLKNERVEITSVPLGTVVISCGVPKSTAHTFGHFCLKAFYSLLSKTVLLLIFELKPCASIAGCPHLSGPVRFVRFQKAAIHAPMSSALPGIWMAAICSGTRFTCFRRWLPSSAGIGGNAWHICGNGCALAYPWKRLFFPAFLPSHQQKYIAFFFNFCGFQRFGRNQMSQAA